MSTSRAIVLVSALSLLTTVVALPSIASSTNVSLNIDAQPLNRALTLFARQSGVQLLFPADERALSAWAPAVVGSLKPDVGLRLLLAGSNLHYESVNANTYAIRTDHEENGGPSSDRSTAANAGADTGPREESESEPKRPRSSATERGIPEVLIRGSNSLNADIERSRDDTQPYVVFGREQIKSSGAANVEELLRTRLTMNYVASTNAQSTSALGNRSSIALRGLDTNDTLILVDGRRVSQIGILGGEVQPDLNGIPLNAIERIEVLPSTASGIYGGNATGGVVNIVLRRDFTGIEPRLTYQGTFLGGGSQRRVDLSGGTNLNGGRTSVLFNASYSDAAPLRERDRSYIATRRQQVYGALDFSDPFNTSSPLLGRTTNIRSFTDNFDPDTGDYLGVAPLTLKDGTPLNSTITSVPTGYSGAASDGGRAFLQNAGHFNLALAKTAEMPDSENVSLLNNPTVRSATLTVQQQLPAGFSAFVDLNISRNVGAFIQNPIGSDAVGFMVPASAPTNPFEQDVLIATPLFGADGTVTVKDESRRALIGLIKSFSGNWRSELDYSFSQTSTSYDSPPSFFAPEVFDAVSSGALDVLRDTNLFATDFSPYLAFPLALDPSKSKLSDLTLRVAGSVPGLPAGPISISLLMESRLQKLGESTLVAEQLSGPPLLTRYSEGSSRVESAYAELTVPILARSNAAADSSLLELQLAGRTDHYFLRGIVSLDSPTPPERQRRSFSSIDPTVGLRIRPINDVLLRASYGTGFRPPYLQNLVPPSSRFVNGSRFRDPKRGNQTLGSVLLSSGGNPNLEPEQSVSKSFGLVLTPRFLAGLRVSVDWSEIRKSKNVTIISFNQAGVNLEDAVSDLVIRAPRTAGNDPLNFGFGPIVGFNQGLRNAALVLSRSIDFGLDYTLPTSNGATWQVAAAGTRIDANRSQVAVTAPALERAGTYSFPTWSANAALSWQRGALTLGWTGRFLDGYWFFADHQARGLQGSARLGSVIYHDLFGSYQFGADTGLVSNLELRAGVTNVLNKEPRLSADDLHFSDTWASPQMATYYVSVAKAF